MPKLSMIALAAALAIGGAATMETGAAYAQPSSCAARHGCKPVPRHTTGKKTRPHHTTHKTHKTHEAHKTKGAHDGMPKNPRFSPFHPGPVLYPQPR